MKMEMPIFLQLPELAQTLAKPSYISIIVLLFLTSIFMKWRSYNNPENQRNLPPSPPKLPLIGNLHQFGTFPHLSLQKLSQRYGPIMFLKLGNTPTYVISCPEGAREVLQTHDLVFANRPDFKIFKKLFYNKRSITTAPYGEYWRQVRSIGSQHLLSKKRVESFRTVREEETFLLMEMMKFQSCGFSKGVNLSEMFSLLSSNVICRAAFGRKYEDGENGRKYQKLMLDFFGLIGVGNMEDFLPWLAWINRINGRNSLTKRVAKELDDFLDGVVEERLARYEKTKNNRESYMEETEEAFIDNLIRIYKEQEAPESLGKDSIKAIILDMFAGGTGTAATHLEWAMSELLRHPSVMKKLQDEVRNIAKGKVDVNEDDLEKMPYLKAVLKETLRHHLPVPNLAPRISTQDVKVMGYDMPAGSIVIVNVHALARDRLLWNDPDEFMPERFLDCPRDFKGQDFQFLPFGSGRRVCPGISFGMALNELALANVVHKFDWKLPNGTKAKDLDMTECPGISVHRNAPLFATPSPSFE